MEKHGNTITHPEHKRGVRIMSVKDGMYECECFIIGGSIRRWLSRQSFMPTWF